MGVFTVFAMRSKASMEIIFSPRSTSPIIFWIQIHQFGQFFLGEICLAAMKTNGVTNKLTVLQNRSPLFLGIRHGFEE
jgi:hypothetical protein